jgi:hypothetical protein
MTCHRKQAILIEYSGFSLYFISIISCVTLYFFIGSVIGAEYFPNRKLEQYKWVLVVYFLLGMEMAS